MYPLDFNVCVCACVRKKERGRNRHSRWILFRFHLNLMCVLLCCNRARTGDDEAYRLGEDAMPLPVFFQHYLDTRFEPLASIAGGGDE
jgi:hypothetical protein